METNLLTPSELIFLHADQFTNGDKFARKKWLDKFKIEQLDIKVSSVQLSETLTIAAFISNHQCGTIKFQVRKNLFFSSKLMTIRSAVEGVWPTRSLEHKVCMLSGKLSMEKGSVSISEIVHNWLVTDMKDPWRFALSLVDGGIGIWERFDRIEQEAPISSLLKPHRMTKDAAQLASGQSSDPIREMLLEFRSDLPREWILLCKGISSAFDRRCKQDMGWWESIPYGP